MITDWEAFIKDLARTIVTEQTPKRLLEVRGKLYELLTHCISPDVILKTLAFELMKCVDTAILPEVISIAANSVSALPININRNYPFETKTNTKMHVFILVGA